MYAGFSPLDRTQERAYRAVLQRLPEPPLVSPLAACEHLLDPPSSPSTISDWSSGSEPTFCLSECQPPPRDGSSPGSVWAFLHKVPACERLPLLDEFSVCGGGGTCATLRQGADGGMSQCRTADWTAAPRYENRDDV